MQLLLAGFGGGGADRTRGTMHAPEKIVTALPQGLSENAHLPVFKTIVVPVVQHNVTESMQAIQQIVLQARENFCLLGGDHSVTYASFKAFVQNHPEAGLVVFDAHPDCMQSFTVPTHENYLRMLIDEEVVARDRVVLVGCRVWDKIEQDFLTRSGIQLFSMKEISLEGKDAVCDAVMSVARQFPALYLSIDIDVADPAVAPGTGYQEPGGLTARELIYFIQRMRLLKNLKGMDVVEVNPDKDVNNQTVLLAAKIVHELGSA